MGLRTVTAVLEQLRASLRQNTSAPTGPVKVEEPGIWGIWGAAKGTRHWIWLLSPKSSLIIDYNNSKNNGNNNNNNSFNVIIIKLLLL